MNRGTLACIVVFSALPLALPAHRLDEYLQATRLSLALDSIVLKIDLTAGVDVAALIFDSIDTNRDGWISAPEGNAYANRVLQEIVLELDGQPRPLDLIGQEFPSVQEMSAGIGVARIEALAAWPGAAGRHSLHYKNNHRPDSSAYLVNALVPESHDIRITAQHRDTSQREFRLEFAIGRSE